MREEEYLRRVAAEMHASCIAHRALRAVPCGAWSIGLGWLRLARLATARYHLVTTCVVICLETGGQAGSEEEEACDGRCWLRGRREAWDGQSGARGATAGASKGAVGLGSRVGSPSFAS